MAASSSVLLYLLKANGALLLVAAAYFGLLRRLTFFRLNRGYLLLGLLFATLYPALPVPALLPAEATPAVFFPVIATTEVSGTVAAPSAPAVDWAAVAVALYATGAAVVLARLLGQLLALGRLRRRSRPAVVSGQAVRVLAGNGSPFSFGGSIYLNPDLHPGPELAAMLRHEQVHVRQWHTLDVLLAQLALAAAWCNPVAWLLRRALLDNLEFLADQAVLATGLDRRTYQYSLLRLSHAPAGPSLVSSFTFPTLKNRVMMMNTPLSSSGQLARYFVAGPLMLAVALGISGARAQSGGPVGPPTAVAAGLSPLNILDKDGQTRLALAGPADYYIDGTSATHMQSARLLPAAIASVRLLKAGKARTIFGSDKAAYIITTKANQHTSELLAFNNKVAALAPDWISFDDAPDPVLHTTSFAPATHVPAALPGRSPLTSQAGLPAPKLPDGIKAYIAQTYPGSTIGGYVINDHPSDKAPYIQYYASITTSGGEKRKLFFNGKQEPLAEPAQVTLATPAPADKSAPRTLGLGNKYYHYGQRTPVVYLDGQRYSGDINDISPKSIANISVFKGEEAQRRFGAEAADGAIVVTTIAKQNDADVRAFNEQMGAAGAKPAAPTPAPAAGGVPYLAAPALAYITQHYPAARLLAVTEVPAPNGGPTRYQAEVVVGRRPAYLLFDGAGQFISESSGSSAR